LLFLKYPFWPCAGINYLLISGLDIFRYKFDDERVTKEDNKRALEEQYGGEEEVIITIYHAFFCFLFEYLPVKD